MKYKELINVNENFQYSVNLQFDLNNINKIKEYIPTKDACEILKIYFNSVLNGKTRSTTLIGPYGKGKSHLLLVLLTLLSNYNEEDTLYIDDLINKIKIVDTELYEIIISIRSKKKKLLPVIINSNYDDLNQAFLLALSESIGREKLDSIILNTYFDVALKVLEKWEFQYKEAINNVKKCLDDYDCSFKELKKGLKSYSHKHYDIFKSVYSCILHGQEFSPLVNSDIIKTYKDITYEIYNYGFNGLFIVFDEFSKFLECVDNDGMMKDLKLLQDFAELSSRTGINEQIHLCCITHKTINEYIKSFKEEKINAFKTVEGRFKEVYFNRSIEQNYEIVSHTLKKTNIFDKFYNKFFSDNKSLYNNISNLPLFNKINNINEVLYRGCFPINPLTVYALVGLSEKIAQNERTLFTFLADDDNNSLKNLLNFYDKGLIGMDKIYDYFKPLLKKSTDEYIKSIWIKVENSLQKVSLEEEKSILKVLGLIYMINDLEIFSPEDSIIYLSLNMEEKDYNVLIADLLDKSIIKRKKITDILDFATVYNRELTKEIKMLCDSQFETINEKEILNKIYNVGYSLPRRYNEHYKITRFFKNIFMTEEELINISNFNILFDDVYCDGIVINLIRVSRNILNLKENFSKINNNKVVLKIPKFIFSKTFSNLLREYESINYIKSKSLSDAEMISELELMQNEIKDVILDGIDEYFSPENVLEYLYMNQSIKKVGNISSYLSDICEVIYDKTPIINNELINKGELSAPIKKARSIVIDSILTHDYTLISSPTSAEATIYKAIVDKKNTDSVKNIINVINNFISLSDNNKISFKELYDILENEPYSVRKGIIPVLLSMALYNLADNIIIYFMNKEIDLDSNNLIKINDNPEKYYILTEKGTTDKIIYLSNLMKIFDIDNMDNTRVNLKKIIEAMKSWILSLPRLLREMNYQSELVPIEQNFIDIKSELLKPDVNNNEFIFKYLPEIFKINDYNIISNNIKLMKSVFDNYIDDYCNCLIVKSKEIFSKGFKGSLTSLLKEWYEKMNFKESTSIYDIRTKELILYIESVTTHNELDVIEKLSKIITGYYVEDWQISEYKVFLDYLSRISTNVKPSVNSSKKESKIVLISDNEKIERNIGQNSEISAIGKTMKNNIEELIEEYGQSLNEQEKVTVLLDIMKKYL